MIYYLLYQAARPTIDLNIEHLGDTVKVSLNWKNLDQDSCNN